MSLRIELGDPAVDGAYLLYGFDVSFAHIGWPDKHPGRPVARRAALRLPTAGHGDTRITFHFSPHRAMGGQVICQGGQGVRFELAEGEGGWAELEIPASLGQGRPVIVEMIADADSPKPRWFGESLLLAAVEVAGEGVEPLPGCPAPAAVPAKVFWGDPHIHTSLSLCDPARSGDATENCRRARDEAGLDFIALTDHAEHYDQPAWEALQAEATGMNDPARFAVVPAFEWSSELYGHRTVLLRRLGPIVDAVAWRTHRPADLFAHLREHFGPGQAITVPHHPADPGHLTDWAHYDADFDRLVEIFQRRGSHECIATLEQARAGRLVPGATVQDALGRGYTLGFTGGGDAHGAWAGSAGLTAVRAEHLTPESVFDALHNRQCWATSGAKIELDVRVNGHPGGAVLRRNLYQMCAEFPLAVSAEVKGTDRIDAVEILANSVVVHRQECKSDRASVQWSLPRPSSKVKPGEHELDFFWLTNFTRWLYVRVTQADGHRAWSSPVWFELVRQDDPGR